jgi:uncharacterized protein (TIGR00730 family)
VRVGVFCGSSLGNDERYTAAAVAMGAAIADAGYGLVYGGGTVGLMGIVADAALAGGSEVIGVLPDGLFSSEVAHPGLTALHEVPSLAERKLLMAELSDVFVALPGGYGTLDELFEMVTWTQLGVHDKPSGLFAVGSFWNELLAFLDGVVAAGFIRQPLLAVDDDPARLLSRLFDVG